MLYSLLILLACHSTSVLTLTAPYYELDNATQHFEDFIQKYDVHYADEQEKQARYKIFKDNLIDANRLNAESSTRPAGEASAVFGITQFMDLTPEEFVKRYTGVGPKPLGQEQPNCGFVSDQDIPDVGAPDSFDWRDQGVVTRVKSQGQCGCCYAFSATGHLESQYAIKYKQLIELSEQQIVDCDEGSSGCTQGYTYHAYVSVMERGGIMTEEDYPYTATDGQCTMDPSRVAVKVDSCSIYQLQSQEKVKQLLYSVGPISIEVTATNFQKYAGGVFSDAQCVGQLNHEVLLVGYGTDPDYGPYWILKNSHGADFGEDGYIRVQRGEGVWSCGLMNDSMVSATIV